ncbi:hypothetical protein ACJ73_05475 [Blastomyces percursus]|uniref:Ketoreductase domain-containing protein n=1 Tax=Blastomyces percursus TaxID=1658174 RepID=A0A1J9Q3P6_9EURO|nr:hypothetical protein ACJ73_05475 [Blastomyces percursus]
MATYAGKTTVIIGGTHGIGLAIAKLLLARGAKVLLTGRRPEPIAEAKAALVSISATNVAVVQFDVTAAPGAALAELQAAVEAHLGPGCAIDFLFLNVGYASSCFAPLMKPGGSILFTTSTSIAYGAPGMAVYSASKAAIYSFLQTLAAESAAAKPEGDEEAVRVNAISPGFVDTPTMGTIGISEAEKEMFV